MEILSYLQRSITHNSSLAEIVDVFEKMCMIPIDNDMVLFETGTFSFTGKPLFYFSLVRQFPDEEEEFYQIHVNVMYEPTNKNKAFSKAIWNINIDENIFDYIRKSEAFDSAKHDRIAKIDIYMDQT